MLLCFSLFCVCCIGNGYGLIQKKYGLIQKKCCCLIQMDGIFFRVFFVFDDFFCIFVLSDLLFFSEICFFYGDPEGACLIQMGRG